MGKDKKDKKNKKNKNKGAKKNKEILGKAPTYTKQDGVEDFLDETEVRSHELIGTFMFASPGDSMIDEFKDKIAAELDVSRDLVAKIVDQYIGLEHPKRAYKYVGGYAKPEDAQQRIRELEAEDETFHIFASENGKWCTFNPSPDLIKDENYREQQLNEIIKGTKIVEQRTKEFFRSEMRKKVEKARLEGTKEGQEILLKAEEPFEAVQFRAESAAKRLKELEEEKVEKERDQKLALEKLELYRAQGKDKVDVREDVDRQLEELKTRGVAGTDQGHATESIKTKLTELNAIERQAVISDDMTKKMAQQISESSASLFDAPLIVPKHKEEML